MNVKLNTIAFTLYTIFTFISSPCHTGYDEEYRYIALNRSYGGFSVSDKAIEYLRGMHPNENFPEEEDDYTDIKIRLNQKFCEEIKSNPDIFKDLYVKEISKLALFFPSCWRIQEYDGCESLIVDKEKLRLQNNEKNLDHTNKIARDIIHSVDYSDKEKITYIKAILIPVDSDSDSDSTNTTKTVLLKGS